MPDEKKCDHELDENSLHIEHDGMEFAYIDCTCVKCGQGGCLGKLPISNDIDWEDD